MEQTNGNKRPKLREVPLADVLYRDGWILLELDDDENPTRAFRRPPADGN